MSGELGCFKSVSADDKLTGSGKDGLRGNLYQQDNHRLAEYAGRTASPYTDVTVTFAGGKEVRLPEKEFHYEKAADLKYPPKQTIWRFVRLNATFVFTLARSLGTGTKGIYLTSRRWKQSCGI